MTIFFPVLVLCLLLSTFGTSQKDDTTCSEVVPLLNPCKPYLLGIMQVSSDCCTAVKTVLQKAQNVKVRRDLCNCFQNMIEIRLNPNRAEQLSQVCHFSTPFPYDKHHCNK
uniref:Non-specific lipid-transfer protein 5 n=1 Tax=Cajanus cajan TaxID=3821 RepID=A0A151SIZ6_CAJCA|nr:Non-specific lipid-transfer protein 5 [Cajanus cajan]